MQGSAVTVAGKKASFGKTQAAFVSRDTGLPNAVSPAIIRSPYPCMKWLVERRNHVLDRLKVTGFNAFELATPSLTTIRLAYALGETAAERLLRRLKVGCFRRDADAAARCAPRALMMLPGRCRVGHELAIDSRVWGNNNVWNCLPYAAVAPMRVTMGNARGP
jgi:hypothetical protein